MSKIKTGYKVLYKNQDNGNLYSYICRQDGVQYHTDKRTYPRFGEGVLTLFRTLEYAYFFIGPLTYKQMSDYIKIYLVKYRPTIKKKRKLYQDETRIYQSRIDCMNECLLPRGTILADWIKLIREVKP